MASRRPDEIAKWDREADVVVVGYGGAGASAAITAHDEGAQVLILEKLPPDVVDEKGNVVEVRHHPNSRMSGAMHFCSKSVEDVYVYQKRMNELYGVDDVPDEMLWVWAQEIVKNPEWIRSLKGSEIFYTIDTGSGGGIALVGREPEFPDFPGARATFHLHNPQSGWGWFGFLSRNVQDRGIEVLYSTPAKELIQDPVTREIKGVVAEQDGKEIAVKARRAVILTTGGFEYNMEMQASYLRVWPFRFYGSPANTGDGIKMAQKVGAALWHMNNVAARVTGWWPDSFTAFTVTPWARERWGGEMKYRDGTPVPQYENSYSVIIVDKYGQRFAKETYKVHTFYWEVVRFDSQKAEFPRIPCHMIFDEKTRKAGPIVAPAGAPGPIKLYEWSPDNSKEIERGWIVKADTLRELAQKIGVSPEGLEETVAKWNRYCQEGRDPEFGREPHTLVPIDTPPYYECVQWPGGPNTQGGPKRNKDAQIVDPDDQPIPRLYSAGELGSIYGFLYEGGGNTAECMAFGRIAGRNAAREKPWS